MGSNVVLQRLGIFHVQFAIIGAGFEPRIPVASLKQIRVGRNDHQIIIAHSHAINDEISDQHRLLPLRVALLR